MYAIGGSANPTINSQGNRFVAPDNPNAKEVVKHIKHVSFFDFLYKVYVNRRQHINRCKTGDKKSDYRGNVRLELEV